MPRQRRHPGPAPPCPREGDGAGVAGLAGRRPRVVRPARRPPTPHPGAAPARRERRQPHRGGRDDPFGATDDANHVPLWVRDDGPGVPPEIATDIFDRFTRGSTEGSGFGLGLSIVGAIAEAHGGTIVLDPTEVGAQFRMILPKGHQ
ncbi:sensor histidine kinase [Burkholderia multivorans]|uniref:sensor histidine kinase n=1 Tax=Burkholderia multivorans TaxID=87883 RepID=UPI0021AC6122